jgi:hypothetical protein
MFFKITLGYSPDHDPFPSKSQLSFILVKTNLIQVSKLVLRKTKLKQKLAVTEAIYFESKVMWHGAIANFMILVSNSVVVDSMHISAYCQDLLLWQFSGCSFWLFLDSFFFLAKGGLISENTGELLLLQKKMPNLYSKLLHPVHGAIANFMILVSNSGGQLNAHKYLLPTSPPVTI